MHLWHGAEVVDVLNKSIWAILKYAKVSLHFSQPPFSGTGSRTVSPRQLSPVLFPRTSVVPCYLSRFALNSYDVDESFVLRGEVKSWEKMRSPRERGKKRPGHSSIQSGRIYQMSAVCGVLGLV